MMRSLPLLLISAWFLPLAHAVEIRIEPERPQAGEMFSIDVVGVWRDGCVPALTDVQISADEILVLAQPSGDTCTLAVRPFSLSVPPVPLQRLNPGVYRVVFAVDELAPQDRRSVEASKLVEIESPAALSVVPEPGAWWPEPGGSFSTSGPGLSLTIDVQSEILVATLNAYGADGEPQWWIAGGRLGQRLFRAQRVRASGGPGLFEPYRPVDRVAIEGEFALELLSPGRAVLRIDTPAAIGGLGQYRSQAISVTRHLFAERPGAETWLGSWVLSVDDQQGSSRRLRFSDIAWSVDGSGYQLRSADGSAVLGCLLQAGREDVLPARCQLNLVGQAPVTFEQVGVNRIDGLDSAGSAASLLRLGR